jgi:hypothetical protein
MNRLMLIVLLLTAASLQAQPPQTAPSPMDVDVLLGRIEDVASTIESMSAAVRFDRVQVLQGDEQRRFGTMVYLTGPPARVRVHFDRMIVDGVPRPLNQQWIFDGVWLVERNEEQKQFFKRQIVPPDANPDHADPLSIGEGPFSLPLNAKKDLINERFEVTLIPRTDDDPDNTFHLHLMPRDGVETDYVAIDLWYARDSLLPVRGLATHKGSGDEDVFTLLRTEINGEVDPAMFDTAVPREPGWDVHVTPWSE